MLSGLHVTKHGARCLFYKNLLDNESVKVSQLLDRGLGREGEVLLLDLTSLGALVTEDEVNL